MKVFDLLLYYLITFNISNILTEVYYISVSVSVSVRVSGRKMIELIYENNSCIKKSCKNKYNS